MNSYERKIYFKMYKHKDDIIDKNTNNILNILNEKEIKWHEMQTILYHLKLEKCIDYINMGNGYVVIEFDDVRYKELKSKALDEFIRKRINPILNVIVAPIVVFVLIEIIKFLARR